MACVSGDDGAGMEDINTAHCSASSLYQGIKCIEQNACQLHHSHVVMHDLRCATCGGEVGAKGKRAPRNLTDHGERDRW
jgi:hypothetical protein